MKIDSLLKKEGITIIEKLSPLKTNLIATTIATKLCEAFPEHEFNKKDLFIKLSRLNMYFAEIPYTNAMAKYVSKNNSIYFNKNLNIDDLDTIAIHECLHYIQESNAISGNMGLSETNGKDTSIALNESAVQLMASIANNSKEDIVTYYNITLPTNSPSYYTLECTLTKQITYFTGTYPLFHSTIYSDNIFKNTFIKKCSKKIYKKIIKNLDKIVEIEDQLSLLTFQLEYSNDDDTKIKLLNSNINEKKEEIFNLFFETQNIIMSNCFNSEFKNIKNMEDLKKFKSRVYNYQYLIGTNKDYTFYKDFFYHAMNMIQDKEEYFEKNGYVLLPSDKETSMVLFDKKEGIFDFIKRFFAKYKKVNNLSKDTQNNTNNIY